MVTANVRVSSIAVGLLLAEGSALVVGNASPSRPAIGLQISLVPHMAGFLGKDIEGGHQGEDDAQAGHRTIRKGVGEAIGG